MLSPRLRETPQRPYANVSLIILTYNAIAHFGSKMYKNGDSVYTFAGAGRCMRAAAPPDGSCDSERSPPCCRTICRLRYSPTPLPPGLVVWNGWNRFSAMDGAMPCPLSSTDI